MELFKSRELQKEFDEFTKDILPNVLSCNLCQKLSCMWHSKFEVSCLHCRKEQCKNCKKFNILKDILLGSASVETVDYLYNYISDFLNLSDDSIRTYFPEIKVERIEKSCYKKRVKSEKNRTQTVNVKLPSSVRSGTFQHGKWKRRFFY